MTPSDEDRKTASIVLAECAAYDPWFPAGGEAMVLAWAQAFAESRLAREDLLAGVTRAYRLAEEGFRPLPSSIIRHASAAYFDQLNALPDDRRAQMDEANHVLQEMGYTPPEAHRWARQVALGRKTDFELSAEQLEAFKARLSERQALEDWPPRPLPTLLASYGRPRAVD